jgi:hypothetical protein
MSIEILRQMVKPSAQVLITSTYSKKKVTLTEPQHPDSSAEIKGLPDDTIVFKADSFPAPDTIFTGARGECKRADYVIIANDNGRKRILFIEMKRSKAPECEIIAQFKGATCLVAYCKEIAKFFYDYNDLFEGYEYRYVSFSHTSINKRKTRIDKSAPLHNTPECMMKVQSPNNIYFDHLTG